jgi:ABC-2 type transport system permease protein
MRQALHAEWTKLRTVEGTGWLLLASIALTVALGAVAAAVATCPSTACGLDPTRVSLTGVYLGQAAIVILAVLAMGGEYGTGTIHVTLVAVPRRATVLAAKAAALTGLVLISGTVAVLASVLAGQLILPGHGYSLSLAVLRAAAGSVLYLAFVALLSLGAAAALRDSATTVGVVFGLLYLPPAIAVVVADPTWQRHLLQVAPMTAGLAIQATTGLRYLPIGPWAGLGVLAAWTAAALAAGGLALCLRDA